MSDKLSRSVSSLDFEMDVSFDEPDLLTDLESDEILESLVQLLESSSDTSNTTNSNVASFTKSPQTSSVILSQNYSPSRDKNTPGSAGPYHHHADDGRYHSYQQGQQQPQKQQQQYCKGEPANWVNSSCPRSNLLCDKSGEIFEYSSNLAGHIAQTSNANSSRTNLYPEPLQQQLQYQPLSGSSTQYDVQSQQELEAQQFELNTPPHVHEPYQLSNVKTFKNPRAPKKLINTVLPLNHAAYTSEANFVLEGNSYKCIICSQRFTKSCYLTQHNISCHGDKRPYKCSKCGKRFREEHLYVEHVLRHEGEKPYKCDICPKQFNHKTDLKRHTYLHTGEKPHNCETCGKGFIRKDHMLRHAVTHKRKNGKQAAQDSSFVS